MHKKAMIIGLAIFILLFSGITIVNGETEVCEKPVWNQGDKWSMGFEKDLSEEYDEIMNEVPENEFKDEFDINDFNFDFDGNFGIYQTVEVVETSPSNKLEFSRGIALFEKGSFDITMKMLKEGIYHDVEEHDEKEWDVPEEIITMSMDVEFDIAVKITGFEYYSQDFALERIEMKQDLAAYFKINGKNLPYIDEGNERYDQEKHNWVLDTLEVKYNDFELQFGGNLETNINIIFSPALDIFQFPIEVGEVWNASSIATTTGTYDGEIYYDINGEYPKEIDQNLSLFPSPIDLTGFQFNYPPFVIGKIQETKEEIEVSFECTGKRNLMLPDSSLTECYIIQSRENEDYYGWRGDDEPEAKMEEYEKEGPKVNLYFSKDEGYFVQAENIIPGMEKIPVMTYTAKTVSDSEAQDFFENKANPNKIDTSIKEDDSSFNTIYLGIITIPLIVIVIGTAVYLNKRKNIPQQMQQGYGQFPQQTMYPQQPLPPSYQPQQQYYQQNNINPPPPTYSQDQISIPLPPKYPQFFNCLSCGNTVPIYEESQIVICQRCGTRIR